MNKINNANNLNFTGTFIINGKLSSQNKKIIEAFKKSCINGKSNESIVSDKCYDVFVSKSPNSERLILFSKFNYLFEDPELNYINSSKTNEIQEKTKLLLVIDPTKNINNDSTILFRKRLENFEKSKEYLFGFNSKLEYWRKKLKLLFNRK